MTAVAASVAQLSEGLRSHTTSNKGNEDLRSFLGICNHWTGLLESNFNAVKNILVLSNNIFYLRICIIHPTTSKDGHFAAKRYIP